MPIEFSVSTDLARTSLFFFVYLRALRGELLFPGICLTLPFLQDAGATVMKRRISSLLSPMAMGR